MTPAKFGLTDNLITFTDTFGKEQKPYDGVDLNMTARFPNGALVAGGTNTERMTANTCYAIDDPSLSAISSSTSRTEEFCDIRPPFLTQYTFYGSYPLMWGLSASATFQSTPGPMIQAIYTSQASAFNR